MECEARVGGGVITYQCYLTAGHDGPHAAREVARSLTVRAQWEADMAAPPSIPSPGVVLTPEQLNQGVTVEGQGGGGGQQTAEDLGYGPAQTTAERYTINPTPPPGTPPATSLINPGTQTRCDACVAASASPIEGGHLNCAQRAEIVSVIDGVMANVVSFCACFQGNPVGHGMDPQFVARLGEAFPPGPAPSSMFGDPTPEGGHSGFAEHMGQTTLAEPMPQPITQEQLEDFGQEVQEPTKQRPGDQDLPTPRPEAESVQDRVIAKTRELEARGDLDPGVAERVIYQAEESKKLGMERYGTLLHAWNGRDGLQDLADEIRDAFMYVTQIQMAREATIDEMVEECTAYVRAYVEGYEAQMGHKPDLGLTLVTRLVVEAMFKAAGGPLPT